MLRIAQLNLLLPSEALILIQLFGTLPLTDGKIRINVILFLQFRHLISDWLEVACVDRNDLLRGIPAQVLIVDGRISLLTQEVVHLLPPLRIGGDWPGLQVHPPLLDGVRRLFQAISGSSVRLLHAVREDRRVLTWLWKLLQ